MASYLNRRATKNLGDHLIKDLRKKPKRAIITPKLGEISS